MKQKQVQKQKPKNKDVPEKKFKAGAVTATIWKNQGKNTDGDFEYKTISLERNYRNSDGDWKNTNTLRINDLPKAKLALQKAYEYLTLQEEK